jgi:hypothetical protein
MAMIKKWTRKKEALNRRYEQMDRLMIQSEKAYEVKHLEQFEAYEECIKFQQDKIIEMIKELVEFNSIIQKMEDKENDSSLSSFQKRNQRL